MLIYLWEHIAVKISILNQNDVQYLNASRDLQTLLVQYVQALEMEDVLQSFDENLEFSARF